MQSIFSKTNRFIRENLNQEDYKNLQIRLIFRLDDNLGEVYCLKINYLNEASQSSENIKISENKKLCYIEKIITIDKFEKIIELKEESIFLKTDQFCIKLGSQDVIEEEQSRSKMFYLTKIKKDNHIELQYKYLKNLERADLDFIDLEDYCNLDNGQIINPKEFCRKEFNLNNPNSLLPP